MESKWDQNETANDPDMMLVRNAQNGDAAALNELLTKIRPCLQNFATMCILPANTGQASASDIVQDASTEAFQHIKDFRGSTWREFLSWLQTMIQNEVRDNVRNARRRKRDAARTVPLPEDSGGEVPIADDLSTPSRHAQRQEQIAKVRKALAGLEPDDEQVIRLVGFEPKDWPEVAELMGRSEDAVRQLYYRALRRLRDSMGGAS